jgi:aerotolerance regulator-like protein
MGIFQGFLHPALLWGTALAAVPLLIHILNRRRHRPLPWAAMRFVLAAEKRTRRRVQLENWLLLFLRMAAVAVLALAIARPFIGKESPLAPLTEKRRDVVLVLDGSASTGYRDVRSVHEAILERARGLLGELDGTRGDRVRLLYAAQGVQLLASHAPEDALAALSTLGEPRDEALDLRALLAELVDLAREDAGDSGHSALEVRLLTDLQRNAFVRASEPADVPPPSPSPGIAAKQEPAPAPAVAPERAALDQLQQLGVTVWVEDLGAPAPVPANLGVETLEPLEGVLGAGLSTEIAVRVHNFGPGGRSGVRVALAVDGQRQPSQKVDVGARASAQVVFSVPFERAGFHALQAEVEVDRLAVDDQRAEVVYVPAPLRVLLVNGAPSDDIGRDEVGILRAVLEPPDDDTLVRSPAGAYAPFVCEEIVAAAFGSLEADPEPYDVIVLANVPSLSAQVVEKLEPWVARGGCLLVTLGDHAADPSALEGMNTRLWRADESGLLPARLTRHVAVAARESSYFRAATFEETHPVLAFFADERWRPSLTELPIYEFVACEPLSAARVLARLDDGDKSPLLLEREYERGRVFLWTSSIDGDWNVFPQSPATLVPLAHELLRYGGTGIVPRRSTGVGGALELELESFPRSAVLVRPDGARAPLGVEPREVVQGLWRLAPIGPLDEAGLWRVETEGARPEWLACQLVPSEGDLERITPEELEALHPAWKLAHAGDDQGDEQDPLERGELWRWLAAAALALLVCETLWAAWIGRGRRLA